MICSRPDIITLIELLYDQDIFRTWNISYETNLTLRQLLDVHDSSQLKWFYENAQTSWLSRYSVPFSEVITKWGLCMNFNMLPADELMNLNNVAEDLWYNISQYKSPNQKSSLQLNELLPWNISSIGTPLKANFESVGKNHNYYISNSFEPFLGVRVIVHNNNELPAKPEQSFLVPIAFVVDAIVEPQVTLVDDGLRSMSYEKRNCFFPGEKSLKYFKVYTKSNCEMEKLSLALNASCGCVPYHLIRELSELSQ